MTDRDYEPGSELDLKYKREWTRKQLARLEDRRLLDRVPNPGRTPDIVLLRDDMTEDPLDDPQGKNNSYVTLHGTVVSSPEFREWGGPELVAYICAMQAGRRAAHKWTTGTDPAETVWFQSASWFTTAEQRRLDEHVLYPVSIDTIQRGLRNLEKQGWIRSELTRQRPHGTKRFKHPRKVYTNHFTRLETMADVVNLDDERRHRSSNVDTA